MLVTVEIKSCPLALLNVANFVSHETISKASLCVIFSTMVQVVFIPGN